MKSIFEENTICRLCLRVSENNYRINNTHHKVFIESIIKLKQFQYIPTDDEYVCFICIALLKKSFNFMQTVWTAQGIICDILKNTDKITKPMLESINGLNNGVNSVNLSSVVICDIMKFDNYSKNEKLLTIDISSSSDEGKESDKCDLIEVEIDFNKKKTFNLDEPEVEIDYIKTEIDDPLTKDFGTDAHDDPKPEPKQIKGKAKINTFYKAKPDVPKRKTQEEMDYDYQPDSTSHSEDSDFDSYDDEGKSIKKTTVDRVYPRKCEHCDYEVLKPMDHYRHYQYSHPDMEYPYKNVKDTVCSICGQLCVASKLGRHEANHVKQKLKCTLCRRVYSNKTKLYRHMQNVHPKRKFTCDYCSKIVKTRSCLVRHIRTHTGSKPFKCHICGDGFAHSGNRSIHIRSKHQNYKYVPKKHKRAKKVRRNEKHNSTDTENSSSDEIIIPRTKRKPKTKKLK